MDHFNGANIEDYLSSPSHNDPNLAPWSPSDFTSFFQQQHQSQYSAEHSPFTANSMGAIYVSNIPLIHQSQQSHQPSFDENGQPIKMRKKPGRKPNPASPALRKAQNRAAQRAFRERKERHLRDLEGTIRQLREQRNGAIKELNQTKSKMDAFRAENWYLKGVVLTLQFVCLHHNIQIPTHTPYLTEEALSDMAKTTPHAIEAYVNAYTRNNINLKPTMAAHFSNTPTSEKHFSERPKKQHEHTNYNKENSSVDMDKTDVNMDEEDEEYDYDDSSVRDSDADSQNEGSIDNAYIKTEMKEDNRPTPRPSNKRTSETVEDSMKKRKVEDKKEEKKGENQSNSLSAIQSIGLQLRLQSTITTVGKSDIRLQPTILQLAIPHDPRIDLIPTPHMRDRMIIFRDIMDYDRCFAMLLGGAMYHGGDPTMSDSWELPGEFFSEFWYLATNYDVTSTNSWRKIKGLPEISVAPKQQVSGNTEDSHGGIHDNHSNTDHSTMSNQSDTSKDGNNSLWTDDVFAEMTAGMPTLQPLDSQHLASGFDFGSPANILLDDPVRSEIAYPLFEEMMGSIPPSRHDRSSSTGKNSV
ncbi:hypothetical protein BDB01DRAFT_774146 [Pilobolus umbonatus]|nr:hypothetical protein BDB01DRAFT_774146 [Pilobolus umbonatus]